jgi:hypothetical protein
MQEQIPVLAANWRGPSWSKAWGREERPPCKQDQETEMSFLTYGPSRRKMQANVVIR